MASERWARNEVNYLLNHGNHLSWFRLQVHLPYQRTGWTRRKGSLRLGYISHRNRKYVWNKWMWQRSLQSRRFIHSFDCRNFGNNLTHAEREKTLNNAMTLRPTQETNSPITIDASANKLHEEKRGQRPNVVVKRESPVPHISQAIAIVGSIGNDANHLQMAHPILVKLQCPNVEPDRLMSIWRRKWGGNRNRFDAIRNKSRSCLECSAVILCDGSGGMAVHTKANLSERTDQPINDHKFKYIVLHVTRRCDSGKFADCILHSFAANGNGEQNDRLAKTRRTQWFILLLFKMWIFDGESISTVCSLLLDSLVDHFYSTWTRGDTKKTGEKNIMS